MNSIMEAEMDLAEKETNALAILLVYTETN
jgi:hypothetical protein